MTFAEWLARKDPEILEEGKKKKRKKKRAPRCPYCGSFLHWGLPWAWHGGYWGGWHGDPAPTPGPGPGPVDPTGGDASSGGGE